MPPKKTSPQPPEVMTWRKAAPYLILSGVFDALRFCFEMFWFFGPAFAALYCTAQASGAVGVKVASVLCGAAATVVGAYGLPALELFGVLMATAVGFIGWLTLGFLLKLGNGRIFSENVANILWFVGGLTISEIPLIGVLPGLTGALIKMFHTQIENDKASMARYEKGRAAQLAAERRQADASALMQAQAAQEMPEAIY